MDAAGERKKHGQRRVSHFLRAVVRHVGDGDAQLAGQRPIDVVEADVPRKGLPVEVAQVEDELWILDRQDLPVGVVVKNFADVIRGRVARKPTLVDDLAN